MSLNFGSTSILRACCNQIVSHLMPEWAQVAVFNDILLSDKSAPILATVHARVSPHHITARTLKYAICYGTSSTHAWVSNCWSFLNKSWFITTQKHRGMFSALLKKNNICKHCD
jgi:hypothetical protein